MKRVVTTIYADMFEDTAVGLGRQLTRRAGIDHVEVNHAAQSVTVDFDNTRVESAEVERMIAEHGYRRHYVATESR